CGRARYKTGRRPASLLRGLPDPVAGLLAAGPLGEGASRSVRGPWRRTPMAKAKTKPETPIGGPTRTAAVEASPRSVVTVVPAVDDPLRPPGEARVAPEPEGPYEQAVVAGEELRRRPYEASSTVQILRQHAKDRMTVWERIDVLQDPGTRPSVLYQNWGRDLDGASLVTAVIKIRGRDVALYGHDFTVRAGSMDATNGRKLANLIYLAGQRGIPLIGMNDSAGAFIPAGVGGLD